nr:MAG TPA: hypothetical protein [Caudoviricetes sp.]
MLHKQLGRVKPNLTGESFGNGSFPSMQQQK